MEEVPVLSTDEAMETEDQCAQNEEVPEAIDLASELRELMILDEAPEDESDLEEGKPTGKPSRNLTSTEGLPAGQLPHTDDSMPTGAATSAKALSPKPDGSQESDYEVILLKLDDMAQTTKKASRIELPVLDAKEEDDPTPVAIYFQMGTANVELHQHTTLPIEEAWACRFQQALEALCEEVAGWVRHQGSIYFAWIRIRHPLGSQGNPRGGLTSCRDTPEDNARVNLPTDSAGRRPD